MKKFKPEIKQLNINHQLQINAMRKENLKYQKIVAKLLAEKTSLLNEIKVLREEYSKYQHDNPPRKKLTPEEIEELRILAKLRAEYERTKSRSQRFDIKTS